MPPAGATVHMLPTGDTGKCQRPTYNLINVMTKQIRIEDLLDKPVWQMTGEEYIELTQYALSSSGANENHVERRVQKAMGVHALAVELGCSDSTVYSLMRTAREEDGSSEGGGILHDAIVSRIGRRIVFDVERARELATKGRER